MAESFWHRELVVFLKSYVESTYGLKGNLSIQSDIDNTSRQPAPHKIKGNIPDLFAKVLGGDCEIVGEAKTPKDFETSRSQLQIKNFLEYVHGGSNRVFCLCVPFEIEIYAENVLSDVACDIGMDKSQIVVIGKM